MKVWICKKCDVPCIVIPFTDDKPDNCPFGYNDFEWEECGIMVIGVKLKGDKDEVD